MYFLLHMIWLASSLSLKQIRKKHAQSLAISSSKTTNNYFIVTGDCDVQDNCVSSPNWPNTHGNNEWCFVQLQASGHLTVSNPFDIETCCDVLGVAGTHVWNSEDVPDYVHSGVGIEWQSDGSVTNSGWQICIDDDGLYATTDSPTIDYCAHDCPNDWIGDGYCDVSCDIPECNYDNNDCTNLNDNDQSDTTCNFEQLMNFAFTALFINDCHDDLEDDDNNISCECLDAMEDANPGVVTDMDCIWDITHDKTVAEQYEDECPQINWALIIGLIIGGIIFLGIIIGWICYRYCCKCSHAAPQSKVIVQAKDLVQMEPGSAVVQMEQPPQKYPMQVPAYVEPLPPGWVELQDAYGRTYFSNAAEQRTTWSDPRGTTIVV